MSEINKLHEFSFYKLMEKFRTICAEIQKYYILINGERNATISDFLLSINVIKRK
jgi:hypothetical protein